MSKFLIRFSLLLLLLSLGHLGLYYSDVPKPKWQTDEHKLNIINTGNSHGNSIVYNSTNLKGCNISRPANTIYYDLQNYQAIKHRLEPESIVLIPISYFSLGLDENRDDIGNDFMFYNYHYVPIKSIKNYSVLIHMELIIKQAKENLKGLFQKSTKVIGEFEVPVTQLLSGTEQEYYLIGHAEKRSLGHRRIGESGRTKSNLSYLTTLVKDCNASGFCPILITPPYHSSYNSQFTAEWLDNYFYTEIREFQSKHQIAHLDYSKLAEISSKSELFKNSDHLNDSGKKIFSSTLLEKLKKEKIQFCR